MRVLTYSLSLIASLCTTSALAVPATQAGADALIATFQTYLGTTAGVVSVQPTGESYAVKLDLSALAAKLPDARVSVSPIEMQLTDNGDGTWGVTQDQSLSVAVIVPGRADIAYNIANAKYDGTFDTALMAFSTSTADMTDISVKQSIIMEGATLQNATQHINSLHGVTTATAAAGGAGVDGTLSFTMTGLNETKVLPPMGDGAAPMVVTIAADNASIDGTVTGERWDAILKLAAFFIANPSEAALKAKQGDLRTLVVGALPLWDHMLVNESISAIRVNTPMGAGSLDKADVVIEANGIAADGLFREGLTLTGLHLPDGLVPEWAKDLLPTKLSMDFALSRFDLAAPAKLALAALDLNANPPLPAGKDAELFAALLPAGTVDLTIAPGATDATAYKLGYEGKMSFGPGQMPQGKGRVTLTGLEKIRAALATAPPEMGGQASMGLGMAGALAKPGAEGELVWEVESGPNGAVLVNGKDLSAMMGGAQ